MVYDPLKNPQNLLGSSAYNPFENPQNLLGSTGAAPSSTGVVAPVDTRTLISQTAKSGYIQGYDTQQGYAPVFVPKGKYVAGISLTGKDMTTGSLNPVAGFTLPDGTQGNQQQLDMAMAKAKAYSDAQAKIDADKKAADLVNNPPPTELAKQMAGLLQNQTDNANAGVTALTEKNTALQGSGISDLSAEQKIADQKLGEIIAEGDALEASYLSANQRAEGSNFNLSRLQGEQAQNYKMYLAQKNEIATRANVIRATSLGLQGRIADAKSTIKDAFDAKIEVLNAKQKSWEAQVAQIQPSLTREENARLEEVKARKAKILKDAEDVTAAQTKAINDLYDAGVAVDSNTALALQKATSLGEVQNILTKFAPELARGGKLDIQLKEAQLANVYSQMNERGGRAGKQYDPEEILAYAQERASTGKMPTGLPKGSYGLVAQIAKELPKPAGSLVDRNTGVKSSSLSPTQEDGMLALYDITKKVAELAELDKKRIKGLLPAATGKLFGTEAQGAYVDLRDEIVDLLARARTGAALTSQEEAFYKSQLPGRIARVGFVFGRNSQSQIDNFSKKINGTLNTRLQGQGASIYGYSQIKVGDKEYKVGDIISNDGGKTSYRLNPDGTLTLVQ